MTAKDAKLLTETARENNLNMFRKDTLERVRIQAEKGEDCLFLATLLNDADNKFFIDLGYAVDDVVNSTTVTYGGSAPAVLVRYSTLRWS